MRPAEPVLLGSLRRGQHSCQFQMLLLTPCRYLRNAPLRILHVVLWTGCSSLTKATKHVILLLLLHRQARVLHQRSTLLVPPQARAAAVVAAAQAAQRAPQKRARQPPCCPRLHLRQQRRNQMTIKDSLAPSWVPSALYRRRKTTQVPSHQEERA